jgi:hypothetical protein
VDIFLVPLSICPLNWGKFNEAQYKQDAMKYYRKNVGKVTMEKNVSDAKDIHGGFPAYLVEYDLVMNKDSTYTMSAIYWVSPFWGGTGYVYYSGDSTLVLEHNTYGIRGDEIRYLEDKWYFWYYSL